MRYVAAATALTLLLLIMPFAIVEAVRTDEHAAQAGPLATVQATWSGLQVKARALFDRADAWADALTYSMSGALRSHSTSEM